MTYKVLATVNHKSLDKKNIKQFKSGALAVAVEKASNGNDFVKCIKSTFFSSTKNQVIAKTIDKAVKDVSSGNITHAWVECPNVKINKILFIKQPNNKAELRKWVEMFTRMVSLANAHNEKELLLHSCCAPCSGEIIEAIAASNIKTTVYFYNPNIHPLEEYEIRKDENRRFCEKVGIECIDGDYDKEDWFERIKGLEDEPERGERCTKCFDMRFERSALFAHENNFNIFATTLGISRWKDMNQINESGKRSASRYKNVSYWDFNWRKQGGSSRMIEISKREHFYQQEYCGCVYSLRDTNKWRRKNNKDRIIRGVKFY